MRVPTYHNGAPSNTVTLPLSAVNTVLWTCVCKPGTVPRLGRRWKVKMSAVHLCRCAFGEGTSGTHWLKGRIVPKTVLNEVEKGEPPLPATLVNRSCCSDHSRWQQTHWLSHKKSCNNMSAGCMTQHSHATLSCAYGLGANGNVGRGFESRSEHFCVLFYIILRNWWDLRWANPHLTQMFYTFIISQLILNGNGLRPIPRNVEGKVCKHTSILFLSSAAVFLIILFPCSGCFVSHLSGTLTRHRNCCDRYGALPAYRPDFRLLKTDRLPQQAASFVIRSVTTLCKRRRVAAELLFIFVFSERF